MLIGQLAAASGIAATTLRFYEANGLLESERDCHGYRRYHSSALQRITRIRALRSAGWSVAEIGQLGHLLETAALGGEVSPGDVAASMQQLDDHLVVLSRVRLALESIRIGSPHCSATSRVRQDLDADLD